MRNRARDLDPGAVFVRPHNHLLKHTVRKDEIRLRIPVNATPQHLQQQFHRAKGRIVHPLNRLGQLERFLANLQFVTATEGDDV